MKVVLNHILLFSAISSQVQSGSTLMSRFPMSKLSKALYIFTMQAISTWNNSKFADISPLNRISGYLNEPVTIPSTTRCY